MPPESSFQSTLKIGKTDVSIVSDDGKIRSITKSSSIAKALQARDSFGWSLVIGCPEQHREAVAKAASKLWGI